MFLLRISFQKRRGIGGVGLSLGHHIGVQRKSVRPVAAAMGEQKADARHLLGRASQVVLQIVLKSKRVLENKES
jgi:hypothetical protein